MTFLAPLFLLGGLALAAPILFHLIRRTTRERTLFSSLRFLQPTPPRLTHRSRLEDRLLLALRCLALALLAFGFARPFLRKVAPLPAAPAETRRLVVLLDVSASMRRAGLWPEAQRRAGAILAAAAPGDEAAVFAFSRQTVPLVSFEEWKATPASGRAALARARLAATAPGWADDRLGDALIRAAEALAETDAREKTAGPRQIYLISDLKAGSRLDALSSYDWPKGIELKVEALRALRPTNAGLQLVADAPDADRLAAPTVRVRVSNAADSTREQFRVGWVRGAGTTGNAETTVDAAFAGPAVDVYVPPGQSRVVPVPLPVRAADRRAIVLRGDDEDFDNTLFVVPPERRGGSVLYFGAAAADDPHGPRFFLQRALPDNPHLSVKLVAVDPGAPVAAARLDEAPLFFVMDPLAPATAAALRGQMLAGKTVLFAPSSAAAAGTLAQLLGQPAVALTDVTPADYAMFGEIDFRHPLFAALADPLYSDFTQIHVWKYRRLDAAAIPGARVLARFDRGDPAVVEIPVGAGRLLALLTGWNPADSQLAVSTKFVPLVHSLLDLAGGPSEEAAQAFVGDPLPLSAAGPAPTVRLPDGATITLPAGTAAFSATTQPGIYELGAGPRVRRVAVNVAPAESRTEPLPADELERYGAPAARPPPDPARSAERAALLRGTEAENRQKLWRWLLGAALAVLLLESALAGWTTRRNERSLAPGGTPT